MENRKKWIVFAKNRKRWIAFGAVLAVVCIGAAAVTWAKGTQKTERDSSIRSEKVRTGEISTTVNSSGTLSGVEISTVYVPEDIVIKKVYVSAGDAVKKGDQLAAIDKASAASLILELDERLEEVEDELDDTGSSSSKTSETYMKRLVLKSRKKELKDQRKVLMDMYKSGKIKAEDTGVIASVNISGETSGSNDAETIKTVGASESTGASQGTVTGTSSAGISGDVRVVRLSSRETEDGNQEAAVISITNQDLASLAVTVPEAGKTPQSTIASTAAYTGSISFNCSGTFQAGESYTAVINLTAREGYAFSAADNYILSLKGASVSVSLNGEAGRAGNGLCIKAVFPAIAGADSGTASEASGDTGNSGETGSTGTGGDASGKSDTADGADPSGEGASSGAGGTGGSAGESVPSETGKSSGSGAKSGSAYGSSAVISGSTKTSGNSGAAESASAETADEGSVFGQTAVFTVASADEMVLTVNIDELDINAVGEGQSAVVTVDALEEEELEGSITDVSVVSSDNGGSPKYTAEITMEKTDGMLAGMSASAVIRTREASGTLLLSADAVSEKHGSSFVYTQKDADGNLSGETEVTTGLSDGVNVEITSGLSEGDVVYYEVVSSEDSGDGGFDREAAGAMRPEGMRPSGENMPSGDDRRSGQEPPSGGMPSGGFGGGEGK